MRAKSLFTMLFSGIILLLRTPAVAQYYGNVPNITVTGEAEIKVAPDNADITIGIETTDSSMVDAKAENDRLVESVTSAIKRIGVDESDIHTDYLNVAPKYDRWNDTGTFLGHNVKRRIVVTLKDISKFDELINDVINAGVSRVLDVKFNVDNLSKYRDQARTMAIKAAADKARDLTAEIGQAIGKAVNIKEVKSEQRSWYSSRYWDRYYSISGFAGSQYASSPESETQWPPAIGKISVTASVIVSFLLE